MSKYAVIEVGSRQEKVVEGDILEVPKSFSLESMNPILLSPRKGSIVTDKKSLSQCSVDLELIDEKKLKKINIFQYKNKTGKEDFKIKIKACEKSLRVISIARL